MDSTPLRQSNIHRSIPNYDFSLTATLEADKIRSQYGIEVEGHNIPAPIKSFEEMKLPARYLSFLRDTKQVVRPTPIQMQAIGCLIKERDVIALSPTGAGKTYAYILPMLLMLENDVETHVSSEVAPLCLIVVPSRELMSQIFGNVEELITTKEKPQGLNAIARNNTNTSTQNSYSHQHHNGDINPSNCSTFNYVPPNSYQGYNVEPCSHNSARHQYNYQACEVRTQQDDHYVVGICGGVPISEDIRKLNSSTKVLVATPGRLIDLCERDKLSLSRIKYFVVDECDRLLDMGLEEQLRKIVSMVTVHGRSLQVSLWSATLPDSLERIVRSAVVDPVYICTGIKHTIGLNIKQCVMFMHSYMKEKTLLDVLRRVPYPPVIIFVQSKHKADEITELLHDEQFHAAAIHSDKLQTHRNEVMCDFRDGEIDVLVATDLMSRGVDIPIVTHVINFDTPDTIEDYVHRCGRCGRLGREGVATTFLTLDCKIANELKHMLHATGNEIPAQLLDTKNFGKKVLRTEMGDRIVS